MSRRLEIMLGGIIAFILLAGPVGYAHYRDSHLRNLRLVQDGVLYRSGQLSLPGLKTVIHNQKVKTVVSLRDAAREGAPPPDAAEEKYCRDQAIHYVRIPPKSWRANDAGIASDEGFRRFREVMDDPKNYPVLIHCYAGVHRTGAFCAVYRMEYEHWSNEDAIKELKACGYKYLEDEWDLLGYLEAYQPRWKTAHASTRNSFQK